MLKKGIFAYKLLQLVLFLSSLSLVFLLHVRPMYADPDPKDNEVNMLKAHMEEVRHTYPELDKKMIEIEEKLKSGAPVKDCCKDCHI